MRSYHIKTNRIFTAFRKYAWLFTLMVGIGGLWFPKLGLLVLLVMLGLTVTSFLKGRYWCGNICPHGSLFDRLIMPISRNGNIPRGLKTRTFALLFFLFFMFNISRKVIKVAAIFGTMPFWDKLGFIFVVTYLMVLVVGGLLNIFFAPRTWCQFCPMGTIQTYSYKLGKALGLNKKTDEKITVAKAEKCHSCGKCARVCPMQLKPYLEFSEENQFDHEACIRCGTCVKNCPAGILSLSNHVKAAEIVRDTDLAGYENRQKIQAVVEKVDYLAQDVAEYTFRFRQPERVQYQAGQFILVKIQDVPKMYRAYSISSFDPEYKRLSVTVKLMAEGYGSGILAEEFREGNPVELEGPMGRELVVDKKADKVLLVAGGIGITPFRAIVKDLALNPHQIGQIQLVYGVNTADEFLYNQEFVDFAAREPRFQYIQVVANDQNWTGRKGFVTDAIREMDLTGYKVYMCGPKPMTDATSKALVKLGVREDNILAESA